MPCPKSALADFGSWFYSPFVFACWSCLYPLPILLLGGRSFCVVHFLLVLLSFGNLRHPEWLCHLCFLLSCLSFASEDCTLSCLSVLIRVSEAACHGFCCHILLSRYWSLVNLPSAVLSSLHFFGRCHIQFFVAKLATAALVKGTLLFCSKKIKINLGKAFLSPNLFRAARVYFLSAFPCLMAPSPVLLFLAP